MAWFSATRSSTPTTGSRVRKARSPSARSGLSPPSPRSEERRVGKECRSRCDWSSDVCSSDLDGLVLRYKVEHTDDGLEGEEGTFTICSFWLVTALAQIGRASCRERV